MKKVNIKMFEIRDRATCIPAWAIRMLPDSEGEIFMMKQCGYGFAHPCIMLISIEAPWHSARCSDEWRETSGRTMAVAHQYIEKNFDTLKPCEVIDVEFILGEVEQSCQSCLDEQRKEALEAMALLEGKEDEYDR
jgi:hypothetical protein